MDMGLSWPWSYSSWIYNYLCNQYLSSLMMCVRISTRARCTPLCDKVCQWLATGRWFSPDSPVSSTNKTDRHDITEILLKVALNTIKQTNKHCMGVNHCFYLYLFLRRYIYMNGGYFGLWSYLNHVECARLDEQFEYVKE